MSTVKVFYLAAWRQLLKYLKLQKKNYIFAQNSLKLFKIGIIENIKIAFFNVLHQHQIARNNSAEKMRSIP